MVLQIGHQYSFLADGFSVFSLPPIEKLSKVSLLGVSKTETTKLMGLIVKSNALVGLHALNGSSDMVTPAFLPLVFTGGTRKGFNVREVAFEGKGTKRRHRGFQDEWFTR